MNGKRLYKSRDNRMISGVCAGIAEYFGIDPTLVRVATAILIFAAACQLLEVRFKAQAMAPLHSLAERIPETACVLRSRQQYTVPLNEVAVGDIFLIRPGDVIPVDGVVIEGETTVDESALTGAAAPVAKHKGSTVYAATANQGGACLLYTSPSPRD